MLLPRVNYYVVLFFSPAGPFFPDVSGRSGDVITFLELKHGRDVMPKKGRYRVWRAYIYACCGHLGLKRRGSLTSSDKDKLL